MSRVPSLACVRASRSPASGRRKGPRTAALAAVAILCSVVTFAARSSTGANAAQPEPNTDWSWYVNTTNTSTLYQLGYNQGSFDKSKGNVNSQVVLDFGGQNQANTQTYDNATGTTFSYGQVESLAENFAHGYWDGTGSDTSSVLRLGIGTCNCVWVGNNLGVTWGQILGAVDYYIRHIPCGKYTCSWASQVQIWGGDDFETWGGAAASDALSWESGYEQTHGTNGVPYPYVDYGSLDGCPPYGGCSGNGWSQSVYWHLSWGAPPAYPLPEIYYGTQTNEWVSLSQWGYNNHGGEVMVFTGPLDEYDLNTSTFSSGAAWSSLVSGLTNCGAQCNNNMSYQDEMHKG